jgi:hypothetical protein
MTTLPFLTLPVRGKKDAILVRQRARQVAALLRFPPAEQACVAAATFAIVCQGLQQLGSCAVAFAIENRQLHVYVQDGGPLAPGANSVNRIAEQLRLVKPVPPESTVAESDLALILRTAGTAPVSLFEEIVKQNQEVLTLLRELYACRQQRDTGQPAQTQAA